MSIPKFPNALSKPEKFFKRSGADGEMTYLGKAFSQTMRYAKYSQRRLYLGKANKMIWHTNRAFWISASEKDHYIDISKSEVYLTVGLRGCMPKGTLVKTTTGLKKIEEVGKSQVLSYNFSKNLIENKLAESFYSGRKRVVKIHTDKGVMECSEDHKWFVKRNGEIIVVETRNILETDELILGDVQ